MHLQMEIFSEKSGKEYLQFSDASAQLDGHFYSDPSHFQQPANCNNHLFYADAQVVPQVQHCDYNSNGNSILDLHSDQNIFYDDFNRSHFDSTNRYINGSLPTSPQGMVSLDFNYQTNSLNMENSTYNNVFNNTTSDDFQIQSLHQPALDAVTKMLPAVDNGYHCKNILFFSSSLILDLLRSKLSCFVFFLLRCK